MKCRIPVGKSEGKGTLEIPRWMNDIKIDLKELGMEGLTGLIWLIIRNSNELL
jgi:hypothetical protein